MPVCSAMVNLMTAFSFAERFEVLTVTSLKIQVPEDFTVSFCYVGVKLHWKNILI
jgi:hypothetical protein